MYDRELQRARNVERILQNPGVPAINRGTLIGEFGKTITAFASSPQNASIPTPNLSDPFARQGPIIDVSTNRIDGEPMTVTLTAQAFQFDVTAKAVAFVPMAVIEFGGGGHTCVAVVDFLKGMSFPIQASFLRVSIWVPDNAAAFRQLGGHVTRGYNSGRVCYPIRTMIPIAFGAGPPFTETYICPPFARRFFIRRASGLGMAVTYSGEITLVGANVLCPWIECDNVGNNTIIVDGGGAFPNTQAIFEIGI